MGADRLTTVLGHHDERSESAAVLPEVAGGARGWHGRARLAGDPWVGRESSASALSYRG